jgi:uncharacterized protein (DUF305 family)
MKAALVFTGVLALSCLSTASAQNANEQPAIGLPRACLEVDVSSAHAQPTQRIELEINEVMHSALDPMGDMNETQKSLHQAMTDMHGPMMQGMMAKDADVAWICSMIPHHQGAIAIARAALRGGDDPESKKLAEETLRESERGLARLIAWAEKHAAKESRNETTGSTGHR